MEESVSDRRRSYCREYARRRMQDPEYRAKHAANERRRRAEGKVNDSEWRKAWRAANPDKFREIQRKASKKYAAANPDKGRARRAKFRAENPTYFADRREIARKQEKAYRDRRRIARPEFRAWRKRRVAKAGVVLTIQIVSLDCGVCFHQLRPDLSHPHPLSTSVGHEPPLSVVAREGWTVIVERPEHLQCNLSKGERQDCELVGHAAMA